jgi:hypothetical protein
METENQSSFILPMPQDFPSGIADEDTVIPFIEDTVTPMTIDASAPGDVIELSDDFDFDGYQVVRREFFAHTFEPSITFNNYCLLEQVSPCRLCSALDQSRVAHSCATPLRRVRARRIRVVQHIWWKTETSTGNGQVLFCKAF